MKYEQVSSYEYPTFPYVAEFSLKHLWKLTDDAERWSEGTYTVQNVIPCQCDGDEGQTSL